MSRDNRICKCENCEWHGLFSQLLYEEACPICDYHDVDIEEWTIGFSTEGDYQESYSIEDLAHFEREEDSQLEYPGQFLGWQSEAALVAHSEILEEHLIGDLRLSVYTLGMVAEDAVGTVKLIIEDLMDGGCI